MESKVLVTGDSTSRPTVEMFNRMPAIDPNYPIFNISSNVRVNMGMSNEKHDAGQNFLPYFDSQNITLTIPAPLSGLELFLYTSNGSPADFGGFVRLRLTTINYLNYLLTTSNNESITEVDGKPEYIFDAIRLHSVN